MVKSVVLHNIASVHSACLHWMSRLTEYSLTMQGGSSWNRAARFNHIMYGVGSMKASADRICECIAQQPPEHAVVVMAHNGPAGLGDQQHDICGRDWLDKAGEHHLASMLDMLHH